MKRRRAQTKEEYRAASIELTRKRVAEVPNLEPDVRGPRVVLELESHEQARDVANFIGRVTSDLANLLVCLYRGIEPPVNRFEDSFRPSENGNGKEPNE